MPEHVHYQDCDVRCPNDYHEPWVLEGQRECEQCDCVLEDGEVRTCHHCDMALAGGE